jgi:hypothetical protein
MSDVLVRRGARAHRVRAVIAGLLLLPSASGCYTNVPVWEGTPTPETEITVGLSDRGRSVLAGQLGPGARHVTGRLVRVTDSAYVMKVRSVDYISNSSAGTWSGEEVNVSRDLVSGVMEKRLSRGRSWLVVGAVVVGLALATTIAINGFGSDPGSTKTGGGPGEQQ